MASTAEAHGAAFGILHFPVLTGPTDTAHPHQLRAERDLVALSSELGLPAIDLRPVLSRRMPLERYANGTDPIHLHHGSTATVGEAIGEALLTTQLVDALGGHAEGTEERGPRAEAR